MYNYHRVADLFPPMNAEDFERLKHDICAHGLREPVVRYQGAVVDGRHRLQICEELGIEPHFKDFHGDESDLLPFVISMNLARRHLTVGQRAALGAKVEAYLSRFTKARQLAGLKRSAAQTVPANLPERWNEEDFEGEAREEAGRRVHVSGRSISDYKALEAQAPELAAEVARGGLTLYRGRTLANGHVNDEPELTPPLAPEPPPPRLLKKNAMLTASWIWPEPVEALVKSRMRGYSLNVCSGACDLGDVRVDLNPRKPGVIKADMRDLPFPDESFETVISDPPWRVNWFDRWRPFFELVRVCKVGGQIIFNSYYVPWSKQVKRTELYVRQDERFASASILSIFERVANR